MIPDEQLDFAACVSSGQVFRFRQEGDIWRGVDGGNLIEAQKVAGGWEVRSRPDPGAWRALLRIDQDLLAIQDELIRREPRMEQTIRRLPGLRTLRPAWPHEVLVSFLCTPNNHMSRIVRMAEFLASKGARIAPGHHAFPRLDQIALLTEEELRDNGFGYRAATIPRVGESVAAKGKGWLAGLMDGSYEAAREALMSLPGVGPKLADCICLFGLHFDEAVPIDTHVWKVCAYWFSPTEQRGALTRQRYERARTDFVERFGNISGWAQQYLFYEQFLSYRRKKSS